MFKWIAAAGLAAGALLAAGAAGAAAPTWTPTACQADTGGRKVDCGVLTVDESRGTASKRRIAIPVAIIRASDPKPGLPPVIYLHGGPGGAVFTSVPAIARSPLTKDFMAVDQDWIFFDQRGGGLAVPSLDCGELALNDAGPLSDATAKAAEACGQRFAAAGVDLSRYNSADVAGDVADLKTALGLQQFDLYGGSYGTRVEFAVITHAPQGLRSVVFDSPWPPEATWAEGGPQLVSNAVKIIFARCAADPTCKAKHPDVTANLDKLARQLIAGPITKGNKTYTADDLGGFLMDQTYSARGARSLPRDIDKIAAGDMTPLDEQMADRSGYFEGQHLAFLCKEEFPFEQKAKVAAGTENDPVARMMVASFERYFDVCRAWPVGKADPVEQKPVSSPVPVLFLAAEIDPGCPPQFAEAAARRFSHGQIAVFPNTTHGVASRSACGRKMVRAFFQDPSKPIDKSCLSPEHDRFVFTPE